MQVMLKTYSLDGPSGAQDIWGAGGGPNSSAGERSGSSSGARRRIRRHDPMSRSLPDLQVGTEFGEAGADSGAGLAHDGLDPSVSLALTQAIIGGGTSSSFSEGSGGGGSRSRGPSRGYKRGSGSARRGGNRGQGGGRGTFLPSPSSRVNDLLEQQQQAQDAKDTPLPSFGMSMSLSTPVFPKLR